jgi:hypothetical protein
MGDLGVANGTADKGKNHMQIHPLEPNIKPPEELSDLHFSDVYMWVRKGNEAADEERKATTPK